MKLQKKKRRWTIIFFKEHFEYSSPSNMYKNLNTTTNIEENKTRVNKIKKNLADLMMKFKNDPTNNAKRI